MTGSIPELFGSMVFNNDVMTEKLPGEIYASLQKTVEEGRELDINVANAVAIAMKDWAIEKGATHFTHWFQPMTGITAEKHDSFISPTGEGRVIMEFSGRELIKGEPDASSFPSGGLRATFEARGYTSWDPTSYAFIKDGSLCIPTVFCSFSGEVLDKKTPLLRSNALINKQALRVLKFFSSEAKKVTVTTGAEQEYFLIDKDVFKKRKDLILCGRTLFGSKPPKGQELEDHYFGAIKPRVKAFMDELNIELWKLGVYAKTEHNEAAPSQHELAPVFASSNIACDHNQLTMELMKKVADRHSLACLLHEKPFAGISGSGKHVNWSLSINGGENIFKPGKNIADDKRFMLFLSAVIKAVDEHQDLLRHAASCAGNDLRLGASEAPPAIVSIFLGTDISEALEAAAMGREYLRDAVNFKAGVEGLPDFKKDSADRNRTSPFAFTGNKFEFRTPGSSISVAGPTFIINTIVADALSQFADRLEAAPDSEKEITAIIKDVLEKHGRIIFNGNNYSLEWIAEAHKRGLLNLKTTADALPHFVSEKSIKLFTKHRIFSESELRSRCEILLESYCKNIKIEALTMLEMTRRDILPAIIAYSNELARGMNDKYSCGLKSSKAEAELYNKIIKLTDLLNEKTENLEKIIENETSVKNNFEKSEYYRDNVTGAMNALRAYADELENLISRKYWPYVSYSEILFSV